MVKLLLAAAADPHTTGGYPLEYAAGQHQNLSGTYLANTDFRDADPGGADFTNAYLLGTDFRGV